MTGEPYSKERQLARGDRRYRRKVASPKQWAAIDAAKITGQRCRHVTIACDGPIQRHHIVERDAPHFGDDVADNIMPLCQHHHGRVTSRDALTLANIAELLTDEERAYVVGKLGEDGLVRLFGATR